MRDDRLGRTPCHAAKQNSGIRKLPSVGPRVTSEPIQRETKKKQKGSARTSPGYRQCLASRPHRSHEFDWRLKWKTSVTRPWRKPQDALADPTLKRFAPEFAARC